MYSGDEFHYLFICEKQEIKTIREKSIPIYYTKYPPELKLSRMFIYPAISTFAVQICYTNTFLGELFRPVSQRVQMNFIFNDNVRILCLSCNVKKVGKLVRFKQKGQKQASFLYSY
jgi:hypothetical protein